MDCKLGVRIKVACFDDWKLLETQEITLRWTQREPVLFNGGLTQRLVVCHS